MTENKTRNCTDTCGGLHRATVYDAEGRWVLILLAFSSCTLKFKIEFKLIEGILSRKKENEKNHTYLPFIHVVVDSLFAKNIRKKD